MTGFPFTKTSEKKKYKYCENAFLPRIVTVPVVQEDGVQCKPVVQVGSIVEEGQVIAIPQKVHGCNIHSPVPGQVVEIFTGVSASGRPEQMIKIQLSGSFSYTGKKNHSLDWKNASPKEICECFSEKGVINTFNVLKASSLNAQINNLSSKARTLVVRMFDEDPLRITDSFISSKYLEQVKTGAAITARAAGLSEIVFILSSDQASDSIEMNPDEKYLFVNDKKYPAGFPQQLISSFNKNFKRKHDFTISEEDFFVDATTMYEVYKAVIEGKPSVEHIVQVTGNCLPSKGILNVRLGTAFNDIVSQIGGFLKQPNMIIINGYVTGNSVFSGYVPVTKYVKSISFVSRKRTPEQLVVPCVSCGNCRKECPQGLAPDLLYKYKSEEYPLPEVYVKNALKCSGCGLCNSVCPARLPLTQIITMLKSTLN